MRLKPLSLVTVVPLRFPHHIVVVGIHDEEPEVLELLLDVLELEDVELVEVLVLPLVEVELEEVLVLDVELVLELLDEAREVSNSFFRSSISYIKYQIILRIPVLVA